MKRNETILSLLLAATLSLPAVVFAGTQVPGSTDEARYAAAQRTQSESTPAYRDNASSSTNIRAGSTDEARALAGQRGATTHVVLPSDCTVPMHAAASTDEARQSFGRYLDACSLPA